jgi:hypothetical protein
VIWPTKPIFIPDKFFPPSTVTHCRRFQSKLYSVSVFCISLKIKFR